MPGDPLAVPDNKAHPQIVAIQQFGGGKCTGSIIASNKVLTAAHCFNSLGTPPNIDVFLEINITPALRSNLAAQGLPGLVETGGHLRWNVIDVVKHPMWNDDQDADVDIAILTMESSIPPALITPLPVQPDVLPAPFIAGQVGYDRWVAFAADLIGMGNTDDACTTGAHSPPVRLTEEVLDTAFGVNGGVSITWLDTTGSGSHSCDGDSGSPFVTIEPDFIGTTNIEAGFVMGVLTGGLGSTSAIGPLIVAGNRTFVAQQALDADGDGIEVPFDTCDKKYNPDQGTLDSDGDGWPDVNCDDDDDDDGIPDITDNCDTVANVGQADFDHDGTGDACDWDDDGDFVSDANDNCPMAANPGQENCNADAEALGFAGSSGIVLGDACDPVPCAPADTTVRDFVPKKTTFWATGEAVCVDQAGRLYEDIVDVLGRVKANNPAVSTTNLEAWFCGCEADTLAECNAAPWNCGLSPTAGPKVGSRWRKLSLTSYVNPAQVVPQPLAATFSPFNALPAPTEYRWDYLTDYASWITNQHLWSPTPNDPATFGTGTDMMGVLWVEDPTSVGLSAHGSSCSGVGCSMSSSYLVGVAPDRATVLTTCKEIPKLAPAPWWTYCAMCGETLRLPWESVYDPGYISVIGDHVRVFTQQLAGIRGTEPAGANVTSLFSTRLVDTMANQLVVGPSEPAGSLRSGQSRAIALSRDGSRMLGDVVAGARQFDLRALSSSAGVTPRTGFATAYSVTDGALRLVGGKAATGATLAEYWRWTTTAGWRRMPIASQLAPTAALSTVFGGDRALWTIDRASTGVRLVRIDEATGAGATAAPSILASSPEAYLFRLADGGVALATTTATATRFQLTRLVVRSGTIQLGSSVAYGGELAGAPYVSGGEIIVPLRVRGRTQIGVTTQHVPAQTLAQ